MKILQHYSFKLMPALICLALIFSQALGFKHYYDHSPLSRHSDQVEQALSSTNIGISANLAADYSASNKNKIIHSCIALDSVCFALFAVTSPSSSVLIAHLTDSYLPSLFRINKGKTYSAYLSRAPPKIS
jgi:hypothetical protein